MKQYLCWRVMRMIFAALLFGLGVSVFAESINVKLVTSSGDIRFELYPDRAPATVVNFLKYIDGGHLNGGSFYRVVRLNNQEQNTIKIEVIQGGLSGVENAKAFDPIPLEPTNMTKIKHLDGALSMARSAPNSGTSEFFVCVNAQPSLDFGGKRNPDGQGFAAFGRVIEGMDVVRRIQNMKTDTPAPGKLAYTSGQSLLESVEFISFERE
ncbi:MAG: peptidylprolyl isomerase [Opitutales bacterium]